MKEVAVTKRIGGKVGSIDWNYDFLSHFGNYCCPDERKEKMCDESMVLLKEVEGNLNCEVLISEWWYKVEDIGMYDGYPYWRPFPAIQVRDRVLNVLTWESFCNIRDIRVCDQDA